MASFRGGQATLKIHKFNASLFEATLYLIPTVCEYPVCCEGLGLEGAQVVEDNDPEPNLQAVGGEPTHIAVLTAVVDAYREHTRIS